MNRFLQSFRRVFTSWWCVGLVVVLISITMFVWGRDQLLVIAAWKGSSRAVDVLLTAGAEIDARLPANHGVLHFAVANNDREMLGLALAHGADVDMANRNGVTPLLSASGMGRTEMVNALLRAGARPDAETASGETPLSVAVRNGHEQAVSMLVDAGASCETSLNLLSVAASYNRLELFQKLLDCGADLNPHGSQITPLMAAARSSDRTGVRWLLDHGASVAVSSWSGETPLMSAAGACRPEIISDLLDAGASVSATDRQGRDALAHCRWTMSRPPPDLSACKDSERLLVSAGTKALTGHLEGN